MTATGSAQSTDEIAKSVDTLRRRGSGEERRVLGDGGVAVAARHARSDARRARLVHAHRDARTASAGHGDHGGRPALPRRATTQGDATPFLQDLVLLGTERIEVLRGTGSSVYGSNATGGVVNLVTDTGGGAAGMARCKAEGGGLGMMRGVARVGGGSRGGRTHFSAGAQSTDVLTRRGRQRSVPQPQRAGRGAVPAGARRHALGVCVGGRQLRAGEQHAVCGAGREPAARATSSKPCPVSLDVQHRIEAGQPFSYAGANFVPNLDDPDSRRASRFLSGALVWSQQINRRVSYRVAYHKVVTNRRFDDGPAGVRFPPLSSVSDRIRGGTDTAEGAGRYPGGALEFLRGRV